MPICNPADMPGNLKPGHRLMGLDFGERTIGVAVSDPGLTIATAVAGIRRERRFRDTLATLRRIADERVAGAVVLGLPLNMDGSEGPRAQATRQFAANLLDAWDIPLSFWDERLSTAGVERAMIAADMTRAKRRQRIDAGAAAWILQGFLDHLAALRGSDLRL